MADFTPNEIEATLHGGTRGGEYLEWLGKSNLAALSKEEWQQFLTCVIGGYAEDIDQQTRASYEIPFP